MARSVHCSDGFCEDCYGLTCDHSCHGGDGEHVEADEWDRIYGWGNDD